MDKLEVVDPPVIYLEPTCCADPRSGRMWAEDDYFDCEDGAKPTKYILAAPAQAEIDRLRGEAARLQRLLDDATADNNTAEAQVFALRGEVERLRRLVDEGRPPISLDGPHLPDDHRVWLARQLLDSKNDDQTAYGIVAYFPAVSDIWRKSKDTPHD